MQEYFHYILSSYAITIAILAIAGVKTFYNYKKVNNELKTILNDQDETKNKT